MFLSLKYFYDVMMKLKLRFQDILYITVNVIKNK